MAGDRFEHVVLGIGVNLGAPPPAFPEAGAVEAEDEALLSAFLGLFAHRYRPADPGFAAAVLETYRERCATLGLRVRATTTAGALVEGEAVDVDETGGLLVRTEDRLEAIRFGAVEHLE
jgi:BirA family biotin operon repressor/biotin-[acetyl-CoA-carboxylase] ligase